MWNSNSRKAFFEKLKEKKSASSFNPYPGDAMKIPKLSNKPISNEAPSIKGMPNQFSKPLEYENKQINKKTKLPKLQSFFKIPGV